MCRGGYVANWIPVQEENERRIPLGYHMVTIGDPRKQRICKGYAKDMRRIQSVLCLQSLQCLQCLQAIAGFLDRPLQGKDLHQLKSFQVSKAGYGRMFRHFGAFGAAQPIV